MNVFSRLFGRKSGGSAIATSHDLWRDVFGGRQSRSGPTITPTRALEVATVLACVRVIANGVAQVPWRVYADRSGTKKVATDHPLHPIISLRPNDWQTSFGLRETIIYHACLCGNAYVWKGAVGSARRIRVLEPIEPHRVRVKRAADKVLSYQVTADDGQMVEFDASAIWHILGPSWNGWSGMEAVRLAREAIGLSIATESAHADMHKSGARVTGLLSMRDPVGQEKYEFLAAWLDRHSEGGDRSGRPIILDNQAEYTHLGLNGVDAQHLETRRHQIEEVCRAFGVMPIMVGHSDKAATYASAEQMFLAHVVHTLSPWYERIEQSADIALLTEADRASGHYTKFIPNALMRGAAKDRADFYTQALGAGGHGTAWMTPNEVRALEEMNPIDGGDSLPVGSGPAANSGDGNAQA